MDNNESSNELYKASHLVILLSYSLLCVILIGESFVMEWEMWAVVLIAACMLGAWYLHIRRLLSDTARIWIYSFAMMASYFFYGVHPTSTFDLATVMVVIIMIYTMTGEKKLITLCQLTFFTTFFYDLALMFFNGESFESLVVTRLLLHIGMVLMAGGIARTVLNKWEEVIGRSGEEIQLLKTQTDRLNYFLANVSHEIRTPINAVMGLTSVLEKENLPAKYQKDLDAISKAGHRVAEQMSDILDYTEIDMGRLMISHENYMINSLINDFLTQLSFSDDYGLDLVVDMEASIPAELVGDTDKLKKILLHLITNGYKFTREGGVSVHIYPVKRYYGINLIIEVRDTGIGIEPEELDHIYERFYQSDSGHTRIAGGLGLGLSIVNGFVKEMGGVMKIESTPGKGTCVRVSIPQGVSNPEPCLFVGDKENCRVAGFLSFMTTGNAGIRDFYMEMITHLVTGLSVSFDRVQSIDDLKKLVRLSNITHLFVGTGEYLSNRGYIDSLTDMMNVAVVADRGFSGEVSPRVTLLAKPFYGSQVANFLNHAFDNGVFNDEKVMKCPGLRTLVVDDEPMNLLVARGIFETYGMIVSVAGSGEESISLCEKNRYDLVFMDHMMPGMDGVEAMKRIKSGAAKRGIDLPVIALTANAISSAKEMFLSEGFDGFVPKPVELSELERVLKYVLPKSAIVFEEAKKPSRNIQSTQSSPDAQDTAAVKESTPVPAPGRESTSVPDKEDGDVTVLDKEGALKYCMGDEEFYEKLLDEYASGRQEKLAELGRLYEEPDRKDYMIRVHSIKSTSKMIGAVRLSEKAFELEMAAKNGDEDTILKCHAPFVAEYGRLMEYIAGRGGSR